MHVRQAVIAAEDRNFYSELDFASPASRAVKNNLFGGDLQAIDDYPVRQERAGRPGTARVERPDAHERIGHRDEDVGEGLKTMCCRRIRTSSTWPGRLRISAASAFISDKPVERRPLPKGRCWQR